MTDAPGRTYKYYPTSRDLFPAPLWAFGSGLTYTTWDLAVAGANGTALPASWTVHLTNTGAVDSDEVVQVFFVPLFTRPGCPTPHRQLIDFQRVANVKAGATVQVPFSVAAAQLELVDVDGSKGAVPGNYAIEFTNGEDATARVMVKVD